MAEIDWNAVGERIRERRMALGLSQKDVAEPDYTAAYLSLVESGSRRASGEAIGHIAAKLNTDNGYLLHGHPEGLESRLALALQDARIEARSGDAQRGREQLLSLLEETRSYGVHLLEAKALEYLGPLEELGNDLDAAAQRFEHALELYADEPAHLRFRAVAGIARCALLRGEVRYAIHVLEDYLLQLQREGLEDPTALMRTYSGLVAAYSFAGLRKESADAAERALALGGKVSDPEQIACMNTNVGHIMLEAGRVDEALRAAERAEAAYEELGWRQEVAVCQHNRSVILIERGDLDEARAGLLEALATLEKDFYYISTLTELGRVERLAGNPELARSYLEQAEADLAHANPRAKAEYQRESALQMADPDERDRGLVAAADAYLACDVAEAAATLTLLGDLRKELGDFEGSAQAYRAALDAGKGV